MPDLIEYGYLGLFIGSFLAATIIPFASEAILVAMLVAGGNMYICIGVATLGNWAGGMSSYYLGYIGKLNWIHKYLKIEEQKIIKWKDKINKYGSLLAFFTWVALIGDVMAVALGFFKVSVTRVAIFMFFGKCIRYIIWAYAFYYILN